MKAGKKTGTPGVRRTVMKKSASRSGVGRLADQNRTTASNGRKTAGGNPARSMARNGAAPGVGTRGRAKGVAKSAPIKATRRSGPVRRSTH